MARAIVIDTFSYNGEPIAELRIKYLYPYVHEFVIVEARETHAGNPKEFLYFEKHASVFQPYMDKIKYIVIDKFPNVPAGWEPQGYMGGDSWYRERYQRDVLYSYLSEKYKQQPFIVMVCDVDEIPKLDTVENLPSNYFGFNHPVRFEMNFYYYHFGWCKKFKWYHAYCVNDIGASKASFSEMRTGFPSTVYIKNSGWHASYFLNIHGLKRKLESFAHRECDVDQHKSEVFLRDCLAHGKDISARGESEDLEPYDVSVLPKEFQEFHAKMLFLQEYS